MLCSQRPELNTDTEERPHTHTTQHIPWRDRGYVQAVEVMQEDIMRWCTRVSKSESIEEIADDDIRNTIQTEVHRRPSKIPKVRSDGKLPRPTMHGVNVTATVLRQSQERQKTAMDHAVTAVARLTNICICIVCGSTPPNSRVVTNSMATLRDMVTQMSEWLWPTGKLTSRRNVWIMEWMKHAVAASRLLLAIRNKWFGGKYQHRVAKLQALALPEDVGDIVTRPPGPTSTDEKKAITDFALQQCVGVLNAQKNEAVTYVWCGRRSVYAGSTMEERNLRTGHKSGGQGLLGEYRRVLEHETEILKVAATKKCSLTPKHRAFMREPEGEKAVIRVAVGDVPTMRAYESGLIHLYKFNANKRGVGRREIKVRHSVASRTHRRRELPRRRNPRAGRDRPGSVEGGGVDTGGEHLCANSSGHPPADDALQENTQTALTKGPGMMTKQRHAGYPIGDPDERMPKRMRTHRPCAPGRDVLKERMAAKMLPISLKRQRVAAKQREEREIQNRLSFRERYMWEATRRKHYGPLDVMGPGEQKLLLSYISDKTSKVEWDAVTGYGRSNDVLYVMAHMAREMLDKGKKRTAQSRLRWAMLYAKEAPLMDKAVKAPSRMSHRSMKVAMAILGKDMGQGSRNRMKWIRQRTKVVKGRVPTYATECYNMVRASKDTLKEEMDAAINEGGTKMTEAMEAKDMTRIKKYWKLPFEKDR